MFTYFKQEEAVGLAPRCVSATPRCMEHGSGTSANHRVWGLARPERSRVSPSSGAVFPAQPTAGVLLGVIPRGGSSLYSETWHPLPEQHGTEYEPRGGHAGRRGRPFPQTPARRTRTARGHGARERLARHDGPRDGNAAPRGVHRDLLKIIVQFTKGSNIETLAPI